MKLKIKGIKVELRWWEIVIVLVLLYGLLTTDFQTVIELLSNFK